MLAPMLAGDRRMADILTLPPLHPRRVGEEIQRSQHNRNTRSQGMRDDVPVITEVPTTHVPVADVTPTVITVEEVPEVPETSGHASVVDREQAVQEQEALNRIIFEDYIEYQNVRAGFTVAGEREVEVIRREDMQVFMDGNERMTDVTIKCVLW